MSLLAFSTISFLSYLDFIFDLLIHLIRLFFQLEEKFKNLTIIISLGSKEMDNSASETTEKTREDSESPRPMQVDVQEEQEDEEEISQGNYSGI